MKETNRMAYETIVRLAFPEGWRGKPHMADADSYDAIDRHPEDPIYHAYSFGRIVGTLDASLFQHWQAEIITEEEYEKYSSELLSIKPEEIDKINCLVQNIYQIVHRS